MEENTREIRAKMIDVFLFKNKRKRLRMRYENNLCSRYIMEPQLKFGYKKHTIQ